MLQIWCLSKVRTRPAGRKGDLRFFLLFSLKAHNYYPAYHIGPDFSNWKVPALWNFLHKKRFYNKVTSILLLSRGSAYFDRPGYWMSAIFPAKLWKTVQSHRFKLGKKEQTLSEVCMIKKTTLRSTVYLRRDEKIIFKRLVYTPPDLLPRFTCKVNLSNTKDPAWFLILTF